MKGSFISFVIGVLLGVGGYWFFAERHENRDVEEARQAVVEGAENVKENVKETVRDIDTEQVKEDLRKTGVVIREKAEKAGTAIADVAGNAKITATIKTKLATEPGVSALNINVDTTDGVVTLSGTANSEAEVAKAVNIAYNTDGVRKVISTIQLKAATK